MAKPGGARGVQWWTGPGEPKAAAAATASVQLPGCAGALLPVCEETPSSEEVLGWTGCNTTSRPDLTHIDCEALTCHLAWYVQLQEPCCMRGHNVVYPNLRPI